MKHPRNLHTGIGLPVFISFNELAWLAIVGAVFIAAPQLAKNAGNGSEGEPMSNRQSLIEIDKAEWLSQSNHFLTVRRNLEQTRIELEKARRSMDTLKEERNSALTEKRAWRSRLEAAEQDLAAAREQLEEVKDFGNSAEDKIAELKELLESQEKTADGLRANMRKIEKERSSGLNAETLVRKELLGLRGELDRVGILLDCSSSMKDEQRWAESISVVKTWLEYLPIENCFLIAFNDYVSVATTRSAFPALDNDGYLPVSKTDRATSTRRRKKLVGQIRDIQPEGGTYTIEALAKAYEYRRLQTIILFTDGEPRLQDARMQDSRRPRNKTDEAAQTGRSLRTNMKDIIALCRLQKKEQGVTVNVVAIGDYFDKDFGTFLRNIAKETGGAFIGR